MKASSGNLFIGVPIPPEAQLQLVNALKASGQPLPGKLSLPPDWHITLVFLGKVGGEKRQDLVENMVVTRWGEAFFLSLKTLGAFPHPQEARVLWMGIEKGLEPLCDMAERTQDLTARIGFPREEREYSPHLTLSRVRPPRDLSELVGQMVLPEVSFHVEEIVLYQTREKTRPGEGRYQKLKVFPLAPSSAL